MKPSVQIHVVCIRIQLVHRLTPHCFFAGECLLDQPQKPLALPDVLPGVSYSLDRQCELAFGTGSKPCPFIETPCNRLWCTGKTRGQLVCQTRHFPWADGTTCGDGKLCLRGVCTDKQEITKTRVSGVKFYSLSPEGCNTGILTPETPCIHVQEYLSVKKQTT